MFPFFYTIGYSAGFRGRNHWLTFESDLEQLRRLRERVVTHMAALDLRLPEAEWDLLLALRHYVHKVLPHDGWKDADRCDAFTLLDQVGTGAAYRCVEQAQLLCQIYQAFGIPARVLTLSMMTPNLGVGANHVVAEAWWDAEGRWVVMDSTWDAHWEHQGEPLSAEQVQQLVLTGRLADVRWAFGPQTHHNPAAAEAIKPQWAGYFAHVACDSDVAYLTQPFRKGFSKPSVAFLAPQVVPQFQNQGACFPRLLEPDPATFWFACNQVTIQVSRVKFLAEGKAAIDLELDHCAPWFDKFEVEADGAVVQEGSRVTWTIAGGSSVLTVRTVNAMGRMGRPAQIGFLFYPESDMAQAEAVIRQAMSRYEAGAGEGATR